MRTSFSKQAIIILISAGIVVLPAMFMRPRIDAEQTGDKYDPYYRSVADKPAASEGVIIPASDFTADEGVDYEILSSFEGESDVLKWDNRKGSIHCTVEIARDGLYAVSMKYFPLPGRDKDIGFGFQIDASYPFDEAARLSFTRVWKDEGGMTTDNRGNERRPRQVEAPRWREEPFRNVKEYLPDELLFFLSEGTHTLTIVAGQEPFAFSQIRLTAPKAADGYALPPEGYAPDVSFIELIQAEKSFEKSDPFLYPMYDRRNASTIPSDPVRGRMNTVGKNNWNYPGQCT